MHSASSTEISTLNRNQSSVTQTEHDSQTVQTSILIKDMSVSENESGVEVPHLHRDKDASPRLEQPRLDSSGSSRGRDRMDFGVDNMITLTEFELEAQDAEDPPATTASVHSPVMLSSKFH